MVVAKKTGRLLDASWWPWIYAMDSMADLWILGLLTSVRFLLLPEAGNAESNPWPQAPVNSRVRTSLPRFEVYGETLRVSYGWSRDRP